MLFIWYSFIKEVPKHKRKPNCRHRITKHYLGANRPYEETGISRMTHVSIDAMRNQFVTLVMTSPNHMRKGSTGSYDRQLTNDFPYHNHGKPKVANPPMFLQLRKDTDFNQILHQRKDHRDEIILTDKKRPESNIRSPMKGNC